MRPPFPGSLVRSGASGLGRRFTCSALAPLGTALCLFGPAKQASPRQKWFLGADQTSSVAGRERRFMRHIRKRWLLVVAFGAAAIVFGGSARASNAPPSAAEICPTGQIVIGERCPVVPVPKPTTTTTSPSTTTSSSTSSCSTTTKPAYFGITVGSFTQTGKTLSWAVKAYDSNNNLLRTYCGPAQWGVSIPGSPYAPLSFSGGKADGYVVSGLPMKSLTIAVKIPNGPTLTSHPISIIGPLAALQISRVPGTVTAPADSNQTITLTAYDAAGNVDVYYNVASPGISWRDARGILSPAHPAAFVNGVSTTSAHLDLSKVPAQPARPVGDQIHVETGGKSGDSNVFIIASNRG